ncbi:uncharacterized protein ACA1_199940 [Acanthamoeba castellanii str. Neff]|uniref:WH2 domain-containing protein n=1 Tax=Acanthamoeba castellanii (strain ATCC 30010 / Neff) TaxID=1257118 RepID=L8H4P2_ACACF|nr:uncharacterized protein ACA1_199940 [Acanthamoeba castellanii str. Neff]ELR19698.1 hypothetical protein ACA1_199940 [Acanthamoeba castellanii str. Neff]
MGLVEEAEREAASTKRELEDVKVKREEARKRLRLKQQQQIQSLKMNSMQRQIGQKQQSLAAPPPGSRASSRQSTRASRRVSGGQVVSHITRVIQEMARLEATVTSAEEAQARAESELLEYAAERRKTEEALVAMQQQLENVTTMLGSAIDEMRGDAQLVELLTEVKVGLNGCHMILTCKTLTLPAAGGAQGGAAASSQQEKLARRRGMTFGAAPAVPSAPAPPPPAPASSGFVPPPPPPAADLSLLSAIREGKQSADLQALRQKRASMRKSVVVVQSLTDTLREAMKMRNDAMMGGEDDDDEDEDDWLG